MEEALKPRLGPALFAFVLGLLLVATAYRWWLVADAGTPYLPIPYVQRVVTTWTCAGAGGYIYALATGQTRRGVGLALMTVPLWQAVWSFVNSIPSLKDDGSERIPYTLQQLSNSYISGLVSDIGFVGVGFLIWIGFWPQTFRQIARAMTASGVPRHNEARSAWHGVLLFPALLIGSVLLNRFIRSFDALNNGTEGIRNGTDEAGNQAAVSIWANMTPFHDVMISLTAGFTEELVYRAVGLTLFLAVFRKMGMPKLPALASAIVLQALIFAGAHGGYGTWAHVLLPLAFGLFIGIVYWFLGLWAAVVLHVLVDIVAFVGYTSGSTFYSLVLLGLMANFVVSFGWAIWWLWRRFVGPAKSPS